MGWCSSTSTRESILESVSLERVVENRRVYSWWSIPRDENPFDGFKIDKHSGMFFYCLGSGLFWTTTIIASGLFSITRKASGAL